MNQEPFLIAVAPQACDLLCHIESWQTSISAAVAIIVILISIYGNSREAKKRDERLITQQGNAAARVLIYEIKGIGSDAVRKAATADSMTDLTTNKLNINTKLAFAHKEPVHFNELISELGKIDPLILDKIMNFYDFLQMNKEGHIAILNGNFPLNDLRENYFRLATTAASTIRECNDEYLYYIQETFNEMEGKYGLERKIKAPLYDE
jgi:hypothetical protein